MVLLMFMAWMSYKNILRALFAIYLATCCQILAIPTVLAEGTKQHALSDIEQSIKAYINRQFPKPYQTNIILSKLDPQLRLARCPQALDVFYPTGSRRMGPTSVGVRCLGLSPWQIYVPLQVRVFGPAVISKRTLLRGTIIHASDLAIAKRELSGAMHGYYTSFKEAEGMELKYNLAEGHIIGPKSLKARPLVKRGDIVTILAETKGLQIQVKGKALMNGFRGQSIRIKNSRTDKVLQGEVIATRTVRIKL